MKSLVTLDQTPKDKIKNKTKKSNDLKGFKLKKDKIWKRLLDMDRHETKPVFFQQDKHITKDTSKLAKVLRDNPTNLLERHRELYSGVYL